MRERTLVGLFVLIAGGLLIGTMLTISGGLGAAAVSHRAYFKFAGGVQSGAPVRYGGLNVGKVTRVRVDPGNSTRIEIDLAVDRDAPIKTDSVAKISTLGPLTDNYIEIDTGTRQAPLAPPGSELPSAEAFGLPQLGDAVQGMMPDVHSALQKLNVSLDGLQVTIARANDLLNDRNRASIGSSLDNVNRLVADARPKVTDSLNNLNGLLNDARPKVSASLTNVQDLTKDLNAKLGPLLDDVKTTTARANDTLSHVDSTLLENRPDVRATVVALRDTLAQLNQTLDQNSANIDELLDNIRMSTENLRALTETLERAPASLIRGIKVPERKPGER
ncbi:MAG: MlaD family protein [Bryobacteraceae bacterium]|jgi:phospholipid/cholesterol/gamma-HCH transport system substrate-binding protein